MNSIRYKFSVFFTLLLFFLSAIITITVLYTVDKYQIKDLESDMLKGVEISEKYISQMYEMTDLAMTEKVYLQTFPKQLCQNIKSIIDMNISLYSETGSLIYSNEIIPHNIYNSLVLSNSSRNIYFFYDNKIYFKGVIKYKQKDFAAIILSKSIKSEISFFEGIRNKIIVLSIGMFTLSLCLCFFYFKRFTVKILKLKKNTLSIVDGNYNIDIIRSNDEIEELSKGIQYMGKEISKNIEEITREKYNLLLALDKVKKMECEHRQFIGNVTHEFKTPLTSIKAYIDLLKIYQDDQEFLNEAITSIGEENDRLYKMVEKVLKLQALEKYDFEFDLQRISIQKSINNVCQRLSGKAEKYQVTIVSTVEDVYVYADEESINHVFLNLIDNAIKYNKNNGQINIYTKKDKNILEVLIEDTGIGIPLQDKEKIFEPFYTSSRDRFRETGGSGLGLSIVKEFLEKQKGKITLLKSNEEGSVFKVSIPLW